MGGCSVTDEHKPSVPPEHAPGGGRQEYGEYGVDEAAPQRPGSLADTSANWLGVHARGRLA